MPPIGPGPVPTNYAGAIAAHLTKAFRQREHRSILSALGYIGTYGKDVNTAIKTPDASKASGIIAQFGPKDFKEKLTLGMGQANRVIIPWVDRKTGEPKQGDARLTGGNVVNRDTMEMGFDWFFDEDQTEGVRSRNNLGIDDLGQLAERQADYVMRCLEEAFVAFLFGSTTISTTTSVARSVWGSGTPGIIPSTILQNAIRDFSASWGSLLYAAGAASRAAVQANDGMILTSQEVMRLETQARTLKDPLKGVSMGGGDSLFVGFAGPQGMEQLKADGQIYESQALASQNPIAKAAVGVVGSTLIIPIDTAVAPEANVGRFVLAGEGSVLMAMVERPDFKKGMLDRHGMREAVSFVAAAGFAVPYFDGNDSNGGQRRASICLEHFARTLT